MVEKNGILCSQIDMKEMRILNEQEIKQCKITGVISGNDYLITKMAQILPLYGLTLRRNEFLVVWRDSNYDINKEYLEEARFKISNTFNINAYIEKTSEKALEIIKRKKFNKIILISDLGRNYDGKEFVNSARDILGFQIFALFISQDKNCLVRLRKDENQDTHIFYIHIKVNYLY